MPQNTMAVLPNLFAEAGAGLYGGMQQGQARLKQQGLEADTKKQGSLEQLQKIAALDMSKLSPQQRQVFDELAQYHAQIAGVQGPQGAFEAGSQVSPMDIWGATKDIQGMGEFAPPGSPAYDFYGQRYTELTGKPAPPQQTRYTPATEGQVLSTNASGQRQQIQIAHDSDKYNVATTRHLLTVIDKQLNMFDQSMTPEQRATNPEYRAWATLRDTLIADLQGGLSQQMPQGAPQTQGLPPMPQQGPVPQMPGPWNPQGIPGMTTGTPSGLAGIVPAGQGAAPAMPTLSTSTRPGTTLAQQGTATRAEAAADETKRRNLEAEKDRDASREIAKGNLAVAQERVKMALAKAKAEASGPGGMKEMTKTAFLGYYKALVSGRQSVDDVGGDTSRYDKMLVDAQPIYDSIFKPGGGGGGKTNYYDSAKEAVGLGLSYEKFRNLSSGYVKADNPTWTHAQIEAFLSAKWNSAGGRRK